MHLVEPVCLPVPMHTTPSSATISIIAIGGGTSTNEVRSIGSIHQTWSSSISITDMSFGIISSIGGISIRGIARGSSA